MEQQLTGFFGKVVSHGDFVSRRLPEAFIAPWDHWLQGGLQHSREQLGERWLEVYLCSPVWRFALAAGVCGEPSWAGVMIPSVDRVGRYFPLTVAMAGEDVSPLSRLEQDAGWYGQVERLALSALCDGFSLNAFDSALMELARPSVQVPGRYSGNALLGERWLDLPDPERIADGMPQLVTQVQAGDSLFWTEGAPGVAPSVLMCAGLPGFAAFTPMLGGAVRPRS